MNDTHKEAESKIATFIREVATLKDTPAGKDTADMDPAGMLNTVIHQARELVSLLKQ